MLNLSPDDITFLLKALLEHREKLERMEPYVSQDDDLKPYNDLIKRLVKHRSAIRTKKKSRSRKR